MGLRARIRFYAWVFRQDWFPTSDFCGCGGRLWQRGSETACLSILTKRWVRLHHQDAPVAP